MGGEPRGFGAERCGERRSGWALARGLGCSVACEAAIPSALTARRSPPLSLSENSRNRDEAGACAGARRAARINRAKKFNSAQRPQFACVVCVVSVELISMLPAGALKPRAANCLNAVWLRALRRMALQLG